MKKNFKEQATWSALLMLQVNERTLPMRGLVIVPIWLMCEVLEVDPPLLDCY